MEIRVFSDVKVCIETKDILRSNVVYCLIFPNEKKYIGITTQTLKERLREHIKESFRKGSKELHTKKARAIRKYMEFMVIVFDSSDSLDELNRLEEHYINMYETVEFGYNITSGGGSKGVVMSEETKKKISESNKGNIAHNRAIVQQFDLNGNMIQEFESIKSAINFLGIKSTKIYDAIDKDKIYHKSIWRKKIINN